MVRLAFAGTEHNFQRPALLRKDFILDRLQILEARLHGADSVLLMVSVLGVNQLKDLIYYSRLFKMEPLVEVSSLQEMDIALDCGAKVIGVNNRNLHDFSLNTEITKLCVQELERKQVKSKNAVTVASLSGITTAEDVAKYHELGVQCCLVGETIMKATDPKFKIKELLTVSTSLSKQTRDRVLVKVCGMTDPDLAKYAVMAGANFIGIIFVSSSPRKVQQLDQALQIVQAVFAYGERKTPISWEATLRDLPREDTTLWFQATLKVLSDITLRKPLLVGVFKDQPIEEVISLQRYLGFDLIQLHGNEDADYAKQLSVPVIKVIHVSPDDNETDLVDRINEMADIYRGLAVSLLVDAGTSRNQSGGTGKSFDWSLLNGLKIPVIVAGGINSHNVADLLKRKNCVYGVDVNSGVESRIARKEKSLIQELIQAVTIP